MPRVTMDISYPPACVRRRATQGTDTSARGCIPSSRAFLETGPGRFFPLLPLVWHRGTFQAIRTADGTTYGPHEVRGCISGPFGVYQGIYLVGHLFGYTLTHVPTGRKLATLDLAGACKRLAGELAPLRMGWHEVDPERVTGPDSAKVNALVARYEQAALPVRSDAYAGVGGRR